MGSNMLVLVGCIMILVVDSINIIFINILTIPVGNMIVSISFYVSQQEEHLK